MLCITRVIRGFIFIITTAMRKADVFSVSADTIRVTVEGVSLKSTTYVFDHEPTVEEVLEAAKLPMNSDCRCDGQLAELADEMNDGDVLVVTTKKITQG